MKLAVDCSTPVDHPKHAVLQPLTATERKQQVKDAKNPPRPRVNPRIAVADAIERAETLDEVKTVLADYLRGG